ncbi:hypothetical protein FALBO_11593 [Fusarium albosuccineum]|uniref:Uncharacterized protein n=1 Tax=Fusarium albosuccineum TaxID=1237068 RepID=A0A8H4P8S5_9HYPO|nr:hypothetical protein FALBO_11593 [Fusarium albosuccineum]
MSEHTHYDTRPLLWLARKLLCIFITLMIVDIGMLAISILALIGAGSTDDRQVVQEAVIDFPSPGRHIQRAMVVLAALGLVSHPTIGVMLMIRVGRLRRAMSQENAQRLKAYVPLIVPTALPECHYLGPELVQCGMISSTWVGAIVYSLVHIVLLGLVLRTYYRVQFPPMPESVYEYRGVQQPEDEQIPLPPYQVRPPSYRQRETDRNIHNVFLNRNCNMERVIRSEMIVGIHVLLFWGPFFVAMAPAFDHAWADFVKGTKGILSLLAPKAINIISFRATAKPSTIATEKSSRSTVHSSKFRRFFEISVSASFRMNQVGFTASCEVFARTPSNITTNDRTGRYNSKASIFEQPEYHESDETDAESESNSHPETASTQAPTANQVATQGPSDPSANDAGGIPQANRPDESGMNDNGVPNQPRQQTHENEDNGVANQPRQ